MNSLGKSSVFKSNFSKTSGEASSIGNLNCKSLEEWLVYMGFNYPHGEISLADLCSALQKEGPQYPWLIIIKHCHPINISSLVQKICLCETLKNEPCIKDKIPLKVNLENPNDVERFKKSWQLSNEIDFLKTKLKEGLEEVNCNKKTLSLNEETIIKMKKSIREISEENTILTEREIHLQSTIDHLEKNNNLCSQLNSNEINGNSRLGILLDKPLQLIGHDSQSKDSLVDLVENNKLYYDPANEVYNKLFQYHENILFTLARLNRNYKKMNTISLISAEKVKRFQETVSNAHEEIKKLKDELQSEEETFNKMKNLVVQLYKDCDDEKFLNLISKMLQVAEGKSRKKSFLDLSRHHSPEPNLCLKTSVEKLSGIRDKEIDEINKVLQSIKLTYVNEDLFELLRISENNFSICVDVAYDIISKPILTPKLHTSLKPTSISEDEFNTALRPLGLDVNDTNVIEALEKKFKWFQLLEDCITYFKSDPDNIFCRTVISETSVEDSPGPNIEIKDVLEEIEKNINRSKFLLNNTNKWSDDGLLKLLLKLDHFEILDIPVKTRLHKLVKVVKELNFLKNVREVEFNAQ